MATGLKLGLRLGWEINKFAVVTVAAKRGPKEKTILKKTIGVKPETNENLLQNLHNGPTRISTIKRNFQSRVGVRTELNLFFSSHLHNCIEIWYFI